MSRRVRKIKHALDWNKIKHVRPVVAENGDVKLNLPETSEPFPIVHIITHVTDPVTFQFCIYSWNNMAYPKELLTWTINDPKHLVEKEELQKDSRVRFMFLQGKYEDIIQSILNKPFVPQTKPLILIENNHEVLKDEVKSREELPSEFTELVPILLNSLPSRIAPHNQDTGLVTIPILNPFTVSESINPTTSNSELVSSSEVKKESEKEKVREERFMLMECGDIMFPDNLVVKHRAMCAGKKDCIMPDSLGYFNFMTNTSLVHKLYVQLPRNGVYFKKGWWKRQCSDNILAMPYIGNCVTIGEPTIETMFQPSCIRFFDDFPPLVKTLINKITYEIITKINRSRYDTDEEDKDDEDDEEPQNLTQSK